MYAEIASDPQQHGQEQREVERFQHQGPRGVDQRLTAKTVAAPSGRRNQKPIRQGFSGRLIQNLPVSRELLARQIRKRWACVVIFAGLLIIWRERSLGLQRAQQRKAMGHVGGK